jgi:hypothetical protein
VWALEALRMRRIALGWEAEIIEGGAAACLETGLPSFAMAMLVRAGLPSRAGALAAINALNPVFIDSASLMDWLESNKVAVLTDSGEWPTPETAQIWKQFRSDMLRSGTQKWSDREWQLNVDSDTYQSEPVPGQLYRIEVNDEDHSAWVCTADFQRVVKLRRSITYRPPGILEGRFEEGSAQVIIRQLGPRRWE